jgi:hypothetical protein
MFELRPLSPAAIPGSLAKAERYRLLNEPGQAESICLDVLAVEPDHQDALMTLILAITDQFRDDGTAAHVGRAEQLLPRLRDAYTQAYVGAIINERRARAALDAGRASMAYEWLLAALHGFDRAIGPVPQATTTRCCGGTRACGPSSGCRRPPRPIAPRPRSCPSRARAQPASTGPRIRAARCSARSSSGVMTRCHTSSAA